MAQRLGVAKRTYQNYERGERLPDAEFLSGLVASGWNANWVLTGAGDERLSASEVGVGAAASTSGGMSQPARPEDITLAVQLAEEALDGARLEPEDYGRLVALIYGALVSGLPSAQVLAFAKPAARGIRGSGSESVDRTGKAAAG
ncbi:helix-turn-helix domain-containing protein [Stenotrophomonas sp. 364]|uniref:helix-turn-helix domain-containing protein n=1 Tax=Stenotrophomonas sp. 364 TaxID=2691571 RepID=UPI001F182944|nr:helix-turn-helix domain-containing protein [Stenotrophomonas sp. 364]